MKIEDLRRRLEIIKRATYWESIILIDGTRWNPKIAPVDLFLEFLERECTGSYEDISLEILEELKHWAKYEPRPNEGVIGLNLVRWSKEVLHVD